MFDTTTETEQADTALHCIPPDLPHDDWVRVGMAYHAAGGDFDAWNDWSSGAANYQLSAARDAWRSFRHGGGVGAGTLFHMAGEYGYAHSGKPIDRAVIEARKAKQQADAATHEAAEQARHDTAAERAALIWQAATACPDSGHAYLVAKGVKSHGVRMIDARAARHIAPNLSPCLGETGPLLVIPIYNAAGQLRSLQFIDSSGDTKRPLTGGEKRGGYYAIGKPKDTPKGLVFVICEGFATGASINETTAHAVAVAFDRGNLMHVGRALRSKYQGAVLVFAADDDYTKAGNPGLTDATEAARAVGGLLAVPDFGADRPDGAKDFNDLHQLDGAGAVRACIKAATEVPHAAVARPVACARTATGQTFPPLVDASEDVMGVWPKPEPLPNGLPPVQAFDPELLPEALRGWVADIAHRMQCPPDFVAVAAVTALSGLIGARAVIAPKQYDDWRVVPNLWGLVVGKPGVMKSPALGQALAPLHRLEAAEREAVSAARESWTVDCKMAELAAEDNEKEAKRLAKKDPAAARALLEMAIASTPEPTARRFVVNDATVEKLADLLTVNPWGLLVFRDELHGLLSSMDRAGQEGSRGFYLTAYDGNQGHAVDRIGRGESYVPRVCLAMLGGMQPGKLQAYVREAVSGGVGDDGLLQRFGLAVWPDVKAEFVKVDQWPDTPSKQAAWAVYERLAALLPTSDTEPQEWRFTPEAQELFWEWAEPFETEIRGDELHPALISHLSKYRKLVPALALIFAMVDTPDSGNVVHEAELMRALAWAEYLRSHAERIYSAATTPETTGATALLKKIQTGKLVDGDGVLLDAFTPRLVAVKHWGGLGTADAVRKAADVLVDYGWLALDAVRSGPSGGRPSDHYRINPAALEGGHQ